jgi:uncharacterized protein YbjT (DUF2867 family)
LTPKPKYGVDTLYLTYYPDLASPRAGSQIRELAQRAVAGGVRRIVLISGRGEPQCHAGENAVRESGIDYTILRCAWFAQNFSEGNLRDQVLSGELAFPGGDVAEPFVDLDDVADVAVEALTDPKHAGKIYELSGPRRPWRRAPRGTSPAARSSAFTRYAIVAS